MNIFSHKFKQLLNRTEEPNAHGTASDWMGVNDSYKYQLNLFLIEMEIIGFQNLFPSTNISQPPQSTSINVMV